MRAAVYFTQVSDGTLLDSFPLHPKTAWPARVWLQAYIEFCILAAEILQSNQITEQLILTPIIANDEYQHPVAMWTCDGNCKHYRTRSVREAAKSAVKGKAVL